MPKSKSRDGPAGRRSACPISSSLDVLGDRWTLLVIRDLFRGLTRYGEFLASPEQIPTNILADRLARLEEGGLVTAQPYQHNPTRYAYTLTPKGADLKPVLGALAVWGQRHVPGTAADPELRKMLRN